MARQKSTGGLHAKQGTNAKRLSWPRYQDKRGQFTEEYVAFQRDVSVCYDLVRIASRILEKPLKLHLKLESDGCARAATDGTNIYIPKMHPNRRVATKHELSHIYFDSDIAMRLVFVDDLLTRIEQETGTLFKAHVRNLMRNWLCFFVNVLDDIRVNSLWGLLYPGDGEDMDEFYVQQVGPDMMAKALAKFPNGDVEHFFTYAILLVLRQEPTSTKWGDLHDDIVEAAENVHYKEFPASLLIMKELVYKVARRFMENLPKEEEKPPPRPEDEEEEEQDVTPEDLQRALEQVVADPPPDDGFADDNAGFDFTNVVSDEEKRKKVKAVQRLQDIDVDNEEEMERFLLEEEQRGTQQADEVRKALSGLASGSSYFRNEDEFIRKGVKADVNLVRVKRSQVVPAALTPDDLKTADRWRRFFLRVMGVMATRTEEQGYELLPELYIQQRVGREPFSCFKRDMTGRGFRLNLLIDMSGSMAGRFPQVERLAMVLQRALDFPFVHLQVMGFSCTTAGKVNLFMYPKRTEGLISPSSQVGGVTPISHAIQMSGKNLVGHRDDNHLFLLSDGYPVYQLNGGKAINTRALIQWTRDSVYELLSHKVKVWCFMTAEAGTRTWLPSDEEMDTMFGASRWRFVDTESMYEDSFRFITRQFLSYVRTR